jgi:hypothetical protein
VARRREGDALDLWRRPTAGRTAAARSLEKSTVRPASGIAAHNWAFLMGREPDHTLTRLLHLLISYVLRTGLIFC